MKAFFTKLFKPKTMEYILLMPLMMLVMFVPLIVRARLLELEGLELDNWTGGSIHLDFFSYYKSLFVIGLSYGAFFLLLILKLLNKIQIRKTLYYLPIGLYILLTGLSYAFSPDPLVSARGFIELFQGVVVLLSYMFIIVFAYNVIRKEWHILAITFAFIFIGVMTFIVGFTQYFGFDLLRTDFMTNLIFPSNLMYYAENINYRFGKYTIYATMYNSNFVGSFAALLVPLALTLYMFVKDRKILVLSAIFVLMMVFVGLGSNSRAGMIGMSVGLIMFVTLFRLRLKTHYVRAFVILGLVIIQSIGMNIVSGGRVFGEFAKLSLSNEWDRLEEISETRVVFNDIIFDQNRVRIETILEDVEIIYDAARFYLYDSEGNMIPFEEGEEDTLVFESDALNARIVRSVDDEGVLTENHIELELYHQRFVFYMQEDVLRMSGTGAISETAYPNTFSLLNGYERFASGRGYIWSRSIPLLYENVLIGEGPGMYAISFPQHDYVGKINGLSTYSIVVDKPHNLYLQIGIETGVLSLLAFIGLFILYSIESLKLYLFRRPYTFIHFMGISMFVSVISYLAAGMFNDQIISVAPLFYVMAGTGFAINYLVKKEDRVENKDIGERFYEKISS